MKLKFLLDQNVWEATARFLIELGHDVVRVSEIGLATAEDNHLLQLAQEKQQIFVTRDRDFGNLVFVQKLGAGVLYLRMLPSNQDRIHDELKRVLELYTEGQLQQAFIVIEVGRHRYRQIH
ncbi:MAG: DUF5615 family PIN-like protein [Chloroflexota bacterium]